MRVSAQIFVLGLGILMGLPACGKNGCEAAGGHCLSSYPPVPLGGNVCSPGTGAPQHGQDCGSGTCCLPPDAGT